MAVDLLSDLLSLLKPVSYVSGGFGVGASVAIQWPQHDGIKCYAVVSGRCWLRVAGIAEPVLLSAGDCYLLPPGPAFSLATDLTATPVDFAVVLAARRLNGAAPAADGEACYLVGGHFLLVGHQADLLLSSLPPIVHIRKESDRAAMRWSLERMTEEVRNPQPGGALIAQQLAYVMLVQALRLHLADAAGTGVGWLFALADKQLSAALSCTHDDPGKAWTLQTLAKRIGMSRSIFALRFKDTVGTPPMAYLTRWRMLLGCHRLKNSGESIAQIAAALGYESEGAFGKAFRRVQRCSPRQYARQTTSTKPFALVEGGPGMA
ncbi:MAG: transcriptional regulator, AraC family [Rhodoferax sp.]|nr:transcriptional regulator, AraC family [Rhodoferax sp.]